MLSCCPTFGGLFKLTAPELLPTCRRAHRNRSRKTAHTHAHTVAGLPPAGLLTEIINSRLFTTVRDTLGLTYDVSFELSLFDRLPSGEVELGGAAAGAPGLFWWGLRATQGQSVLAGAMIQRCRCSATWSAPSPPRKLAAPLLRAPVETT